MANPFWAELRWLLGVFLASLGIAVGLKTVAPLYPLPPTLGVILALVLFPSLVVAVVLVWLNQSDNQTP
jgi:hypothetical protein